MMKILQAEYTVSAVKPNQYPQSSKPEIALVGRSNVGKSSFINKFLNRKNLARTSSTPGKTRTLNFYQVNTCWYFVDLPGYGFAKISKEMQFNWGRFIDEYLNTRQQLKGIIQVVDLRHAPSKDDLIMQEWLVQRGLPYLVVATKADKISCGQWSKHMKIVQDAFNLEPGVALIPFSALTGEGREAIADWLEKNLF
jgi:GTP-binding protein